MTQPRDDRSSGSYDDVPDDGVHTVLNIPLRLDVESEPVEPPRGRHRGPGPRTIVPGPPHRGPIRRLLESEHPVQAAVTVGVAAAVIVFTVVALVMGVVTWSVR